MTAIPPKSQPDVATRLLAGVSVPDTPLISRAIDFARQRSEPYLFNHVRSWLFAAILAKLKQLAHDGEVLAVTTILHDLGLAEGFDGSLRFEVEGANAARTLFAVREWMTAGRSWSGTELRLIRRFPSHFIKSPRSLWQQWASAWIGVASVTRR